MKFALSSRTLAFRYRAWLVGVGNITAAVAVAAFFAASWDAPALEAQGSPFHDTDQDGMPDAQELVLGTSPTSPDTDGDGFSDTEELARQSSPLGHLEVPVPGGLSIGMTARGEGGQMHLFCAMYHQDGGLRNKNIEFGALFNGRLITLPFGWLASRSEMTRIPASNGGELVLLDFTFSPQVIYSENYVSFFIAVGKTASDKPLQSAAVVDLRVAAGTIVIARSATATFRGNGMFISSFGGDNTNQNQQPIPPGGIGDVPGGWDGGRVCVQRTSTVGSVGALVTKQVMSASCDDGWDSFCEQVSCSNTVGTTYDTIDPVALIGG